MGNSPIGIVVLVGNGWALFLSGGELSSWGVVQEPCFGLSTWGGGGDFGKVGGGNVSE